LGLWAMHIIDLTADNRSAIEQAAVLLVEGFREHSPAAWPDLEAALAEMEEVLGADRICRAAMDDDGALLGFIGGGPQYDGHVWELHPLVVREEARGRGIGTALVRDLEERVRERGAVTLWLGTDDEDDMTSLGGVDLYPDPLEHLRRIRNLKRHPFEFYRKMGFTIVGVLPDANGPGKPDIYMAKRVAREG